MSDKELFQIAQQPRRPVLPFLASFVMQIAVLGLVLFVGRRGLEVVRTQIDQPINFVFLRAEGPGGGGGGGGNRMPEPPKKVEIPQERQQQPAPAVAPVPTIEPKPLPQVNIPVTTLAVAALPGALEAPAGLPTLSRGSGDGPGGGTGIGGGAGPGNGVGVGPGFVDGIGGDVYRPGNGVLDPIPTFRAAPVYTAEAVRARATGEVLVECTVMPDGRCVNPRILRSLDPRRGLDHGLDQEAVNAALRWRFRPGTRQGKPVPVIVSIAVEFNVR